jgi:hypothetical protein
MPREFAMRWLSALVGTVLVTVLGCQGNTLPPETDPAQGRSALTTVLDIWVKGGAMADLQNASPPIVAYDPDWEAGHKLVKYEIAPTDRRSGVDLLVSVKLTLARKDGKSQEKTVNFSIAVGEKTVVTRKQ